MAETPTMTVVSQINPSPPELSTAFPHETAMAGGGVGGSVVVGGNVGGGVAGVGVTAGVEVGELVGSGVSGGSVTVGVAVGDSTDGLAVGLAVAAEPLGATGDGTEPAGVPEGRVTTGRLGAAGPWKGVVIGTITERLGSGKGVEVGCAIPTSAMLAKIPPAQVTATIAKNGVRNRGTHWTVRDRTDVTNR